MTVIRGIFGGVFGGFSLLAGFIVAFIGYPDGGFSASIKDFWLFGIGIYLMLLGGLLLLSPHKKRIWTVALVFLIPVLLAVIGGACFIVFLIYSIFHGGFCNPHC